MNNPQIVLKPSAIALTLGKIAFFFVIVSSTGQLFRIFTGHGNVHGLLPLFNLDQENNFPSYFSMFLGLSASALLTLITILEKKRAAAYISHWATLALGFLYISIDEIISLHESLSAPTSQIFGNDLPSIFHWAWVIPAMALVIFLALYFFKFLLHLSTNTRQIFLLSGAIYLSGTLGLEMLGGHYAKLYSELDLRYLTCVVVEESLEMTGMIIFIFGLLQYIGDNFSGVMFQIERD